jgi:hypothetical protein
MINVLNFVQGGPDVTCREPLLRIDHLADCHIAAEFARDEQANQELRLVSSDDVEPKTAGAMRAY